MKKMLLLLLLVSSIPTIIVACAARQKDTCFTTAFTAGYVFKNDCLFKQVYGPGMVNVITADGCYYPWEVVGIGAKISYWRANGKTTFLRRCSVIQEVPVSFYLRALKEFQCNLDLYASLGGGFIWVQEKSYLGRVHKTKGFGEVELGLNYPICRWYNLTGAFRYLFPRQQFNGAQHVALGGYELRAGIGFSF